MPRALRSTRAAAAALNRPTVLATAGAFAAVLAFQLWISPTNPPGFIRDEASFALNAYTIAHHLRDQDGGFLPLYFVSFGDYKSPVFVYLLAPLFAVFGPHDGLARGLGAADVIAAIAIVGWLAYRRSRSLGATVLVTVLVGTTPWLFELGRIAVDTTLYPFAVCLVVATAGWSALSRRPLALRCAALGAALGLVTYCYAGGRLLAVLLAAGLVVFGGSGRWRWIGGSLAAFVLTQVPLLVYAVRHPGGLTARYNATTFVTPGMSHWTIARTGVEHYVHDLNLWHWVVAGDPKPYIHVAGAGQLYGALVMLAAAGVVLIATKLRHDRWWWYVVAATLLVPVPAAVTEDRFDALRLAPLPALLAILAIPAAAALVEVARSRWWPRAALAALAAISVVQLVHFYDVYSVQGPYRQQLFETSVPGLLREAFAGDRTVYVDHDDSYALTHAEWYAVTHGLGLSRVSRLPDGGAPPPGSIAFGRFQPCDYVCHRIAEADTYWIAKAAPAPAAN